MIWTLILRFTIADISEEGVTAKEGLLLWCQRKTAAYAPLVDVRDFSASFRSGLALCALLHRHRPDLLDWDALPHGDAHACTRLAFALAAEHLGIPRLLDVEDLCGTARPDEKSVMTYVAQYFHAFNSMEQAEAVSRRVAAFVDVVQAAWAMQNEYEHRAQALVDAMRERERSWKDKAQALVQQQEQQQQADEPEEELEEESSEAEQGTSSSSSSSRPRSRALLDCLSARAELAALRAYKRGGEKRAWVQEKGELVALLGNIQTKLKTYHLREWAPRPALAPRALDACCAQLAASEAGWARALRGAVRRAKALVRARFARLARAAARELREATTQLAERLDARDLAQQRAHVLRMLEVQVPALRARVAAVRMREAECEEARIEEEDMLVLTDDDEEEEETLVHSSSHEELAFELALLCTALGKKLSFVENQLVARHHNDSSSGSNGGNKHVLTPAQLEEFESTFRHFDKDGSNTLTLPELGGALAALGIVYADEDLEQIHAQLAANFGGHVNYDAFLTFLREIIEDTTSPDQLLEAFRGLAGEKVSGTRGSARPKRGRSHDALLRPLTLLLFTLRSLSLSLSLTHTHTLSLSPVDPFGNQAVRHRARPPPGAAPARRHRLPQGEHAACGGSSRARSKRRGRGERAARLRGVSIQCASASDVLAAGT